MNVERPVFAKLAKLVSDGKLSILFIIGLPRGGTTAVERHMFQVLGFDANINEPTLSGPEACWEPRTDERTATDGALDLIVWEEAIFSEVLRIVSPMVETRPDGAVGPVKVIVKEVTNKILPSTVPLWVAISHAVVVVVRQPLLQLESRLISILDRIGSGALEQFGLTDQMPLKPHSSTEVQKCALTGDATWGNAWNTMKEKRDYSALELDVSHVASLHPFLAYPVVQRVIWGADNEHVGLPLSRFSELPQHIRSRNLDWRLGWTPLEVILPLLSSHGSCFIVDFSCFQQSPHALGEALRKALLVYWGNSSFQREDAPSSFTLLSQSQADEHVDQKGVDRRASSWEAWYGTPCFSRLKQSARIEAVSKTPIVAARFPSFLSASEHGGEESALARSFRLYLDCLVDSRAIRSHDASSRGVDSVHDALLTVLLEDEGGPEALAERRTAMESCVSRFIESPRAGADS